MSLKQVKPEDRIVFLKRFAAELMINLEQDPDKRIEIQKLKQKFLEPVKPSEDIFKKSISASIFLEPVYSKKIEESEKIMEIRKQIPRRIRISRPAPIKQNRIPIFRHLRKPMQTQKNIQQGNIQQINTPQTNPPQQNLINIMPEPQQRPNDLFLGKLESLLRDKSIQSIECSGPNKNLLIKRYNQINTTRLILTQDEITNIINNFSQKSRIPIMGGILKAAIGDLIISAVVSEFVGSRFIISKITSLNFINNY